MAVCPLPLVMYPSLAYETGMQSCRSIRLRDASAMRPWMTRGAAKLRWPLAVLAVATFVAGWVLLGLIFAGVDGSLWLMLACSTAWWLLAAAAFLSFWTRRSERTAATS